MIHAAIMGSIERFIAILIEHTAGIFPVDEAGGSSDDPTLYGLQGGTGWSVSPNSSNEFLRKLKLKAGVGYYDYAHRIGENMLYANYGS